MVDKPIKFTQIVQSTMGFEISGKGDFDIVTSGGGTINFDDNNEIDNIDGQLRLSPFEDIFTDLSYTLKSVNRVVYLFYVGSDNTTVDLGYGVNKQVVYVMNLSTSYSLECFGKTVEPNKGMKFYFSEKLGSWLHMGNFDTSII